MDVCVCHIFHFRMVYVIGASSLRRAIDKAPTSIRKSIQGKVFAVPGLSFHPTAKNPNKQLQNLLKKGLKSCKKIVIWHALVNNSLSSHRNNGNRNCSPDVFIKILEPFREQITAIINNQKIGTPNIHKKLVEASYITISPKNICYPIEKGDQLNSVKNCGNCIPWNALNSISCKSFCIIKTISIGF